MKLSWGARPRGILKPGLVRGSVQEMGSENAECLFDQVTGAVEAERRATSRTWIVSSVVGVAVGGLLAACLWLGEVLGLWGAGMVGTVAGAAVGSLLVVEGVRAMRSAAPQTREKVRGSEPSREVGDVRLPHQLRRASR